MSSDWERYKDEIAVLYLLERLTLSEVSSRMVEKHGFDKKKHQYVYMLEKWKLKKNISRGTWEYVGHNVQKRQKQQEASQVQLNGVHISDARVKKRSQRYNRTSLAKKYGLATSPRSPEQDLVRISSPPAPKKKMVWPEHLPWVQFDRKFHPIPFHLSKPLIDSMVRTLAVDSAVRYAYNNLTISTALYQSLDWSAILNQMLPCLHDNGRALVPSSNHQNSKITATEVFKTLLFHLSNKKLYLRDPLLAQNMMSLILGLCRESPAAMDHLMNSADPTSAAVKEALFTIVIRFGQSSLVSKFLATGTNPNALIDHRLRFRLEIRRGMACFSRNTYQRFLTPLQVACAACEIETAVVLLQYQANPRLGDPTPLQIVCSRSPNPNSTKLAGLLLQYGAKINTHQHPILLSPLMEAVAQENRQMVEFLLYQGASDEIIPLDGLEVGEDAAPISPSYVWVKRPRLLNDRTSYLQNLSLFQSHKTITALQIAVLVGDTTMIGILSRAIQGLENRTRISRQALLTACLAADEDLVHQFLTSNSGILDDKVWANAAFCAVSWIEDCRIARLLLKYGVVPKWHEDSVSVASAAAWAGNIELIKVLHSCGYNIHAYNIGPGYVTRGQERWSKYLAPLECALREDQYHTARILLQLGAPISEYALPLALAYGTNDLAFDLLKRGASVTGMLDGLLPLQLAVQHRKGLALICRLIDAGAAFEGDELVMAVRLDDQDLVDYLLVSGADILASGRNGETVLEAATQAGNLHMIQNYFRCGGQYQSKALLSAVGRTKVMSDHGMVEYLLQRRPPGPMDAYETTSFVDSILKNDDILVNMFLGLLPSAALSYFCRHERDIGAITELHFYYKHAELLNADTLPECTILKCGIYHCAERISPLWVAAHMLQESLVKDLILRNYPPDSFLLASALYNPGFSSEAIRLLLLKAYPLSSIKDEKSCRVLLKAAIRGNADPDLIQQHLKGLKSLDLFFFHHDRFRHSSPLQLAASYGRIGCVRALLGAGANINLPARGQFGHTALQAAVEKRDFEMTILLLENGAYVNAPAANQGKTALQRAARHGNLQMATLLLEHDADVNELPSVDSGLTAMESAADNGFIDLVALFLPRVALRGRMRLHFVRAVVFAKRKCHYAIVELLQKHGGWTQEDRELEKTPQATETYHTCPMFLYDESCDGKCRECDYGSDTSSNWSSSDEDLSTFPPDADLTRKEERAADAEMEFTANDLAMLEGLFEYSGYVQVTQSPEMSLELDGNTSKWLDSYVTQEMEVIMSGPSSQ